MRINLPKNDAKYHWTNHVVQKMIYYGLSADRVKRVLRNPKRSEKGIAPDTIAVMQPGGTSRAKRGTKEAPHSVRGRSLPWREEIWVMYAMRGASRILRQQSKDYNKNSLGRNLGTIGPSANRKKVIITAWRYPGVSKIREAIPIPNDILEELKSIKY